MTRKVPLLLALLLAILCLGSSSQVMAKAAQQQRWVETPVKTIARDLLASMGLELSSYDGPDQKVSFETEGLGAEDALRLLLYPRGLRYRAEAGKASIRSSRGEPIPQDFVAALLLAPSIEMISLNGSREGMVGKVTLTSEERREASRAVLKAYEEGGPVGRCFIPRHELRLNHKDELLRLIICFECRYAELYRDNELVGEIPVSDKSELLNAIFARHKVPYTEPPELDF